MLQEDVLIPSDLPINDPPASRSRTDHRHAALEASCDALMALQCICELSSAEAEDVNRLATMGTQSLLHAIDELRMAGEEPVVPSALGFVTPAQPR
jgi:hypothetical protein